MAWEVRGELKAEGLSDAEIVEIVEAMRFTTAHTSSWTRSPSSPTRGSASRAPRVASPAPASAGPVHGVSSRSACG